MSIRCMSRVWDKSERGETELLLLLALADWSDDWGYCHPSIDQMALKIRQSKRNVLRLLDKLEIAGELRTVKRSTGGRGKRLGSVYQVLTGLSEQEIVVSESLSALAQTALETGDKMSPVSRAVRNCDTAVTVSEKTGDIETPPMSPVSGGVLNDLINVSDINFSSSSAQDEKNSPSLVLPEYTMRAEQLYQRLRPSHLIIPRSWYYQEALTVLNRVLDQHNGDMAAAEAYLRPFAQTATERNIAPTNLCWLTEWAATGKIPNARYGGRASAKSPVVRSEETPEERAKQDLILDVEEIMRKLKFESSERRQLLAGLDRLPLERLLAHAEKLRSATTSELLRTAIQQIE